VLNEERLLSAVLKNISPHVDEIVVVDGGPNGPSEDATAEIAKRYEKVAYQSGKFATLDGAWDMATQRNTAISAAKHDMILLLSADMFFLELGRLREAIEGGKFKIFFSSTFEFWRDTKHLRQHSDMGTPTYMPAPILEPIAVDRSYTPYVGEDGMLNLAHADIKDRMMIPQMSKFHLGWLRPFPEQVQKHIRHVKQHRWAEQGESLLRGGKRSLEAWAIKHVLGYSAIPSVPFHGWLPEELEEFGDMKPEDGSNQVIADFEEEYKMSPFTLKK